MLDDHERDRLTPRCSSHVHEHLADRKRAELGGWTGRTAHADTCAVNDQWDVGVDADRRKGQVDPIGV